MGYKNFPAFQKLASADVNEYLMKQSIMAFADYATGTAAIGTANVVDGMTIYAQDVNQLYTYDGSAWRNSSPGLIAMIPTSVTLGSGAGSVLAGGIVNITTAASSIAIDGCFTSAFANYRIIIDLDVSSTGGALTMNLRAGGVTNTAASYDKSHIFSANGATPSGGGSTGATVWSSFGTNISFRHKHTMDIFNPQTTKNTTAIMNQHIGYASTVEVGIASLAHRSTTQFDGIIITAGSNGFTGQVRIYGYN